MLLFRILHIRHPPAPFVRSVGQKFPELLTFLGSLQDLSSCKRYDSDILNTQGTQTILSPPYHGQPTTCNDSNSPRSCDHFLHLSIPSTWPHAGALRSETNLWIALIGVWFFFSALPLVDYTIDITSDVLAMGNPAYPLSPSWVESVGKISDDLAELRMSNDLDAVSGAKVRVRISR